MFLQSHFCSILLPCCHFFLEPATSFQDVPSVTISKHFSHQSHTAPPKSPLKSNYSPTIWMLCYPSHAFERTEERFAKAVRSRWMLVCGLSFTALTFISFASQILLITPVRNQQGVLLLTYHSNSSPLRFSLLFFKHSMLRPTMPSHQTFTLAICCITNTQCEHSASFIILTLNNVQVIKIIMTCLLDKI